MSKVVNDGSYYFAVDEYGTIWKYDKGELDSMNMGENAVYITAYGQIASVDDIRNSGLNEDDYQVLLDSSATFSTDYTKEDFDGEGVQEHGARNRGGAKVVSDGQYYYAADNNGSIHRMEKKEAESIGVTDNGVYIAAYGPIVSKEQIQQSGLTKADYKTLYDSTPVISTQYREEDFNGVDAPSAVSNASLKDLISKGNLTVDEFVEACKKNGRAYKRN